ncbi:MAG: arginine--tRNA ligase [Candidatus Heimdallarchaeota archaeon]
MLSDMVYPLLEKSINTLTEIDSNLRETIRDSIEIPPSIEFGERSSNIAFKLTKKLKQSPFQIAETLTKILNSKLSDTGFIARAEAKKGYVNFFFDFITLIPHLTQKILMADEQYGQNTSGVNRKIVVEHTSINPVKPLHIGNLRNAVLGDIIARLYYWNGWQVEVQNLIDDLGRQVATLIWGYLNSHHLDVKRALQEKFDVWLGRVYSYCNDLLEKDENWNEVDRIMIELKKDPVLYRYMRSICQACVDANLETAWRHGITYDYLVWESDISRSGIWEETFQLLEKNDAFMWEKDGVNAGCFIADLGRLPEFQDKKNPSKIFVRSNGVPTYVAHDVALQLWKFGLVKTPLLSSPLTCQGVDIHTQRPLWTSTDLDLERSHQKREFGNADRVCNVIGVEQDYLQDIVRYSLKLLNLNEQFQNSYHRSYKHVSAPHARFSGRTGNWFEERAWADAVLEDTQEAAFKVLTSKRPDLGEDLRKKEKITKRIAIGAIRYWLAKFSTETEIKFTIDDATSLEGDTGPFLQYAYVRASKILEKLPSSFIPRKYVLINSQITSHEQSLVLKMAEFPEVVVKAASAFQPIQIANYTYELAAAFNRFYETSRVISADNPDLQAFRIDLVRAFQIVMVNALHLLGIPIVEEM